MPYLILSSKVASKKLQFVAVEKLKLLDNQLLMLPCC